jgi:hypothetical protein
MRSRCPLIRNEVPGIIVPECVLADMARLVVATSEGDRGTLTGAFAAYI